MAVPINTWFLVNKWVFRIKYYFEKPLEIIQASNRFQWFLGKTFCLTPIPFKMQANSIRHDNFISSFTSLTHKHTFL